MNNDLEELLADLRAEYVAGIPEKIHSLQNFLTQGEFQSLRDEFHKLKGTGKTYGIPEITILSETLETLCEQQCQNLHQIVLSAIQILEKIYQTRQGNAEYAVDQDQEFIKIQQRNV